MAERKGTASPRWALWDRYVICGPDGEPHIERLRIVQCPLAGVLAHRIHGPDPDPDPHDHAEAPNPVAAFYDFTNPEAVSG